MICFSVWIIEEAIIAQDTFYNGSMVFRESGDVEIEFKSLVSSGQGTWKVTSDSLLILNLPYDGIHTNFVTLTINEIREEEITLVGYDQTSSIYLKILKRK